MNSMYFKNKEEVQKLIYIQNCLFGSIEHIRSLDTFNPIKYFPGCPKRVCGYHESGMD